MTLGNSVSGFSAPLGNFAVGRFHVAAYDMFLVLAAIVLSGAIWLVLRFTAAGLIARGTMQNPGMASALGVAPERVYAATFTLGAALAGLAGGLIAPLSGVVPTMGTAYIAKAFITVITGGCRDADRHADRVGAARERVDDRHVPAHAGIRRGRTSRRRHRAAAPAAARHHRALPAAGDLRPTALQIAAAIVVGVSAILILPGRLELFALINATVFVSLSVLALSLGLIWGFGGILCFGQTAFFGVGAYTYAVASINFGDTTWAVPLALAVPALLAAALGYLMFFGRLSDVYMGVITLTVTLILFAFFNSTAGDQWTIGTAALGGFNGMPGTPPLNMPFDPDTTLEPGQVFAVAVVCLVACYATAKLTLLTRFGRSATRRETLNAATRRGWVQPMSARRGGAARPAISRHILGSCVVFPEPVSPATMTT